MIQVFESQPQDFRASVQVASCYVVLGTKFLLLQLGPGKEEAGAWGVPAGKLEPLETPLEAAARELWEETGIEADPRSLRPLGPLYIRKPTIDYVYHRFELVLAHTPQIRLSSEHRTYLWATRQEARSLPLMAGGLEALNKWDTRLLP